MEIKTWIKENSEEKYKSFTENLVKTKYEIVGIRTPKLRKFAKELLKKHGIGSLKMLSDNIYEEIMLQGFIIAYSSGSLIDKKELFDNYLSKCDCWSLVDSFVSSLKLKGNDYQQGWIMMNDYKSNQAEMKQYPYIERFVLCLSMSLYLNDQYVDEILEYSEKLTDREYTVKMANSWLLATAAIEYFEKVMDVIMKLDEETLRYFKGKIRDSYRISEDKKERVKNLCIRK
ncbi:MAG: DNA alkylation repair protein [Erysipelotrichaceae bacterium]|jgi:3-methyladenine DNA glycosylase AlkD